MLDVIIHHPKFPRTVEEGERFRDILWRCYELQTELHTNWDTYYAEWYSKREHGNWMVEKYADTPAYLTFAQGTVNFYFYIDQSTREPVPLSFDVYATFNAAVPDVYTGPVEVLYVNFDADTYDAQLAFSKWWMNGKF
jgi:hypothetical protein